jgi:hypothetical protein
MSRGDGMNISSRVPAVRCTWEPVVVSCLALNGLIIRGLQLSGHSPGIRDPRAWLPGARGYAEPGHKDELDRANMWRDPTLPQPLR